ncbi:MAG TPA: ERF family protein [Nostoc sp.]|uniref:ERF family protein n=1 Tax=Nostoc sp. TaxID=1180 RepID=UPI002D65748F|nr:ERF family protein [Nostoc sp.]HYX17484.1 ERF family protein [Nostoc sp.]
MQKLISALIKAKAEFQPIHKNKTNPHYKSQYADLDSVLDAVTPALNTHGLAIIQLVGIVDGRTVLETRLYHDSGEFTSSVFPLPETSDPQKIGSALTYARRYSLCAILSVAADEDNDGNAASEKKPETRGRMLIKGSSTNGTAKTVVHPQDLRVKQIREILGYPRDLIVEWLQFQNVERPSQLEVSLVDELIKTMCLAWASDKIDHPNHAQNSYLKHVAAVVAKGADEVQVIQNWMQHIQSPHQAETLA